MAEAKNRAQFLLQPLKIRNLAPDICQFLREAPADRTAGLFSATQGQKLANFNESEPQRLNPPNEGQSLKVLFAVETKPSLRARRPAQQRAPFIKPDRVHA
jgi:hypothetical protein